MPKAIHQYHEGSAYGDGITDGMLYLRGLLRAAGYASEIYCAAVDPRLIGDIRLVAEFEDRPDTLLFVHYSLQSPSEKWVSELRAPRVLIHHHITSERFFTPGSEPHLRSRAMRRQLKAWARSGAFAGAIADSDYNARGLEEAGFPSVATIPMLVDLDRIREHPWNRELQTQFSQRKTVLFVGSLIENNGQVDLVRAFDALRRAADVPLHLVLAGDVASPSYAARVEEEIARRGLAASVSLLDKYDDEGLYALYRAADLYLSLSHHEGFDVPLVEAMAFDVPVIASAGDGVAETLNGGGLVLDDRMSAAAAAAARLMIEEPWLRTATIERQRKALARYGRPVAVAALEAYLRQIGFAVDLHGAAAVTPAAPRSWRIEGPFDSSYSLAIVNRGLALALAEGGESVDLVSRDGPAAFDPNAAFLASHPPIDALWKATDPNRPPDVVLRNQYPPYVIDMRGALRGLANYAWEESGFPIDHVREFNATLNLITVTSRFVAKTLRDNGVHAPIRVVGNGVDAALAAAAMQAPPRPPRAVFRFLHVSSCFPRKGVDALLAAWAKAFSSDEAVELVIKTFPNPHNDVAAQLGRFRATNPSGAPVRLIEGDLGIEEIWDLYRDADAVVSPSRGEGFNLVLAEALAFGRPVVATAFGGHTDFCNPQTAWLCAYQFAPARTHLALADSVWAEPDVGSLARALVDCRSAPEEERRRRAEAGRRRVAANFTWGRVAERTRAMVDSATAARRLPRMGLVSTWNSRCGVATYARSLACAIEPERLSIFANRTDDRVASDEANVRRCWTQGWDDPLDELYEAVRSGHVDAVLVQFNFGFFRLDALARFIDRLDAAGILVFVTLHATEDVARPEITIRLAEARAAFARCRRLLVHSVHDLNRLKAIGLVDNVALFPQGMPGPFRGDPSRERRALGLHDRTLIASFGFLLPHKGLRELVEATALLRKRTPNIHLMMLNALYPARDSEEECVLLRAAIARLELDANVTLVTRFLGESEVLARLAAADVIVYPYQYTQESSSGAIKLGLSSLAPVACTPLPIFDDGSDLVCRLSGVTAKKIAADLAEFLSDPLGGTARRERQRAWVDAHAWPSLSRRLDGLVRGEFLDAAMAR